MLTYAAVGTPAQVSDYLDGFIRRTEADEVIVAHQVPTIEGRLRSVTLLAEAMQAVPA
jgi:alkanesulfonate monooxygenase SsuD/methylene tetrahydromethanopterin reductase-like flavin-dependent oxidoreductase (luciferase family)